MIREDFERWPIDIWSLEGEYCRIPGPTRTTHPCPRARYYRNPNRRPVRQSIELFVLPHEKCKILFQILAVIMCCSIVWTRARYINPSLYRAKTKSFGSGKTIWCNFKVTIFKWENIGKQFSTHLGCSSAVSVVTIESLHGILEIAGTIHCTERTCTRRWRCALVSRLFRHQSMASLILLSIEI